LAQLHVSNMLLFHSFLQLKGSLKDWSWIANIYSVLLHPRPPLTPDLSQVVSGLLFDYKNESPLDRLYFFQKARELDDKVPLTCSIELSLHTTSALRVSQTPCEQEYMEIFHHFESLVEKLNGQYVEKDLDIDSLKAIALATRAFFSFKFGNFREAHFLAAASISLANMCKWGESWASFLLAFALPLVLEVFKLTNHNASRPKRALEIIGKNTKGFPLLEHVVNLGLSSYKLPLSSADFVSNPQAPVSPRQCNNLLVLNPNNHNTTYENPIHLEKYHYSTPPPQTPPPYPTPTASSSPNLSDLSPRLPIPTTGLRSPVPNHQEDPHTPHTSSPHAAHNADTWTNQQTPPQVTYWSPH